MAKESIETMVFHRDNGKDYAVAKYGDEWIMHFEVAGGDVQMISAGRREGGFWVSDRPPAEVENLARQMAAKQLLLWM